MSVPFIDFNEVRVKSSPAPTEADDLVNKSALDAAGLGLDLSGLANGTVLVVVDEVIHALAPPTGMTLHPFLRFNLSTKLPFWHEPEACA